MMKTTGPNHITGAPFQFKGVVQASLPGKADDGLRAYLLSFDGEDTGPVYLNAAGRTIHEGELLYSLDPGAPVQRVKPFLDPATMEAIRRSALSVNDLSALRGSWGRYLAEGEDDEG